MIINLEDYFSKGDKWLYDTLSVEKREVFPPNYKLNIFYTQDHFNNDLAVGKALSRLQEYLVLLDIPNFFVAIHTNKQDISTDLNTVKNIFAPNDVEISYIFINGIFDKTVINTKSICILPWIHLHINSQGQIGTCCQFDDHYQLGHVSHDNLKEVVNGEQMKLVRKQMINGQRPSICNNCWKQEDYNMISARQQVNSVYAKYLGLVEQTSSDGSFTNFKLRSFDFRTSNVCNLKCRMCGGKYSSRIAQEEIDLYPSMHTDRNFVELKLNSAEIQNVLDFFKDSINDLESIYFAGGEPLIMAEHYKILDFLIQSDRTNVILTYNTNLSTLKYKNVQVLDYWKQFLNVEILASIDLIGDRASYVRSGVEYRILEENYLAIRDHVIFRIDSTLTIYNSFNLIDLQQHWIKNFNIPANNFNIRISMLPPEIMSIRVLPKYYKDLVSKKIHEHIEWLSNINDSTSLVTRWQDVLYFMNSDDQSHLLKDFFRLNDDKDRIRNERFEDVFPEYRDLRSYV